LNPEKSLHKAFCSAFSVTRKHASVLPETNSQNANRDWARAKS
jgi:hypothetical protein